MGVVHKSNLNVQVVSLTCVDIQHHNLLTYTEHHGGGMIPEGLPSGERNSILVRLRDYLVEKGYMPSVVLGGKGRCLGGQTSLGK